MEAVVHVRGLTKVYRTGWTRRPVGALQAVDLTVREGTIFGLLGPNGAGKTTMVKLLLGICRPTSGTGSVLGKPLGDVPMRRLIGYLPEDHRYPGYLTGEKLLRFFGRLSGLSHREARKVTDRLLHDVGMAKWRRMKLRKFSKGMKQRIGLAQALIGSPRLLILDEPTDGVDPAGRKEIRDLLLRERDRGATIFLNSHLLSEVERICDGVVILRQGKVLRVGTTADLTKGGDEYLIKGCRFPADPQAVLSGVAQVLAAGDGELHLLVKEPADLDQVIDRLRGERTSITALQPVRGTLEDAFLKVLQDGEEAP